MAVQPRGVNWGPSAFPPEAVSLGAAGPAAKTISGGEGGRGADEAIVSDDLEGQHNPPASQGPLGRRDPVAEARMSLVPWNL
jgi:hypothetical protein